jgi:molecular chaperone Hsp33
MQVAGRGARFQLRSVCMGDSATSASSERDNVLRAMSQDGNFRVMACRTTDTVASAIHSQNATGGVAITLANLLTGTILLRECLAPDLRMQTILQADDRKSRIVADSHADGMTRALLHLGPGKTQLGFGDGAVLQVQRSMHNGAMHQGVVAVPEDGDVSTAFMRYMQESEQVTTMISVGCHMVAGVVLAAGGFVVQLLPEVERAKLAIMAERMEDFREILPLLREGKATPSWLLDETLYGMPYAQLAERPVHHGCNCSVERVTASLASLPRTEIEELLRDGEILEIGCDFCRAEYKIHPAQLRGLLVPN